MMEHHPMSYFESGLQKTIDHIEARLAEMGGCGDCAYERAMVRSYSQLLSRYRKELFISKSRRFLLAASQERSEPHNN